jgi:hypothetical protein
MLQRHYVERSQREIGELFGRDFAAAIVDLDTGGWQGPDPLGLRLASGAPRGAAPAAPAGIRRGRVPRSAADYRQARRRQASEAYYRSLRERYRIVVP